MRTWPCLKRIPRSDFYFDSEVHQVTFLLLPLTICWAQAVYTCSWDVLDWKTLSKTYGLPCRDKKRNIKLNGFRTSSIKSLNTLIIFRFQESLWQNIQQPELLQNKKLGLIYQQTRSERMKICTINYKPQHECKWHILLYQRSQRNVVVLGMHRNENYWPKPNKIKHWAEGQMLNMVFLFSPPCRPILPLFCPALQKNKKLLYIRHYINKAQFNFKLIS